jgi:hypothetical protein
MYNCWFVFLFILRVSSFHILPIKYSNARLSMNTCGSHISDAEVTSIIPSAFGGIWNEIDLTTIITPKKRIEAYCLSDLHADSIRNQDWVRNNCLPGPGRDKDDIFTIIIVPGDIGTEIESLSTIFGILASNYDAVNYCVGNHEAWRRGTASGGSPSNPQARTPGTDRLAANSIDKIVEVLKCAKKRGVTVGPLRVKSEGKNSGVTIMPMQSWYHSGWDQEPDLTNIQFLEVEDAVPFERRWGDFAQCLWPGIVDHDEFASIKQDSLKLPEAFASLNEPYFSDDSFIESIQGDTIISHSHFVPRIELCPEKRFLLEPHLAKVIGSDMLEYQIRRLRPHLHLFGHTHIPIDLTIDSIRYVQWPLGYQREADKQCHAIFNQGPLKVYNSELGEAASGIPNTMKSEDVHWTKYYLENRRDPTCQTLAPWVYHRLETYSGFVASKKREQAKKGKV